MIGDLPKEIEIPQHDAALQPSERTAPPSLMSPVLWELVRERMEAGAQTHPGDPWLRTGVPVCKGGVGTQAIVRSFLRHVTLFREVTYRGASEGDGEGRIDHIAAMAGRLMQLAHVLHEIEAGRLCPSLDDMPRLAAPAQKEATDGK